MDLQARLAQAAITGKLDVYGMQLTSLPPLPANLRELRCNVNKLTRLPALPQGLTVLECANNEITSIPSLPPNLVRFECSNNKLKSLPDLPASLKVLRCSGNKLKILPMLPDLTDFEGDEFNSSLLEPFRSLVKNYQSRKRRILTGGPQLYVLAHHSALIAEFIENVNMAASRQAFQGNVIAKKFSPEAIAKNIQTEFGINIGENPN